MVQLDTVQKFGKDGADAAMRSFGAVSKGAQSAAVEVADYAKRSFEQGSAAAEKLAGVRTLDKVLEIQTDYLRSSYESFVSQVGKMGELATATAREAFAPMESLVAKNGAAA